jgi:hypothetical protein
VWLRQTSAWGGARVASHAASCAGL